MEDDATEGSASGRGTAAEKDARRAEAENILAAGPGSGNRSAALAFLALLLVAAAFLHYRFAGGGSDGHLGRLDSALVAHAELSVAAMKDGNRLAVVPSWPLDLYENLRRDIAVYAALAAAAAYVWSLSARARARRDAFVMYERLRAELDSLRRRPESAGQNESAPDGNPITKG